jgi:hypothetical protein
MPDCHVSQIYPKKASLAIVFALSVRSADDLRILLLLSEYCEWMIYDHSEEAHLPDV